MKNVLTISEEEKNRIRGLHLTESKDNRITSVLLEQEEGRIFAYDTDGEVARVDNSPICIIVNFKSGKADEIKIPRTGNIVNDVKFYGKVTRMLMQGMAGDRPFIDIEAGTSGTGSHDRNREVMGERVEQAIDFLLDEISQFYGPNKLKYGTPSVMEKLKIDPNYSKIEPGQQLPDGTEVPTDPNHEYFTDAQYVQICINPVTETPEYVNLAHRFIKATTESPGHTKDNEVYDVLESLRDTEDFNNFNNYLKQLGKKQDFYEIACERAKVPGAEGKTSIFGYEVDIIPDEIGPPELGTKDRTLNNILSDKLKVRPISDFC